MSKPVLIIQHSEKVLPAKIIPLLNKSNIPYVLVNRFKTEEIPTRDYSGLILLGGGMSVNDEAQFHWLKEENLLLQKYLEMDNFPILGLCLGGQMIAKALGKKVSQNEHKEIGMWRIHLTQEGHQDPIFKKMQDELKVFQWHSETFDIPESAVLLASSEGCANQAFRYKNCVYALQYHPEVTLEVALSWADSKSLQEMQQLIDDHSRYVQLPDTYQKEFIKSERLIEKHLENLLSIFK